MPDTSRKYYAYLENAWIYWKYAGVCGKPLNFLQIVDLIRILDPYSIVFNCRIWFRAVTDQVQNTAFFTTSGFSITKKELSHKFSAQYLQNLQVIQNTLRIFERMHDFHFSTGSNTPLPLQQCPNIVNPSPHRKF